MSAPKLDKKKSKQISAALMGTNVRGQTPTYGFSADSCGLWFRANICSRFSAKICVSQMLFCSRERRESAKISENQRKSAFGLGLSL